VSSAYRQDRRWCRRLSIDRDVTQAIPDVHRAASGRGKCGKRRHLRAENSSSCAANVRGRNGLQKSARSPLLRRTLDPVAEHRPWFRVQIYADLAGQPMTGARFRGHHEETVIPALKPGDTVALVKLPIHEVRGVSLSPSSRPFFVLRTLARSQNSRSRRGSILRDREQKRRGP
jgi:hypothetical protein